MTKLYISLFASMLLTATISAAALAQFAPPSGGCPPGMRQQGFSCVYNQSTPPVPPREPRARWEKRWGAVAIGTGASTTGFGAVTNFASKRQAERAAINLCVNTGGGDACKAMSYFNQCAVIAWGVERLTFQSDVTVAIASRLAMDHCNTRATDCQIFYSGCSLPERVR